MGTGASHPAEWVGTPDVRLPWLVAAADCRRVRNARTRPHHCVDPRPVFQNRWTLPGSAVDRGRYGHRVRGVGEGGYHLGQLLPARLRTRVRRLGAVPHLAIRVQGPRHPVSLAGRMAVDASAVGLPGPSAFSGLAVQRHIVSSASAAGFSK